MHNLLQIFIKNRLTVSFAGILFFIFGMFPGLMAYNWFLRPGGAQDDFSPGMLAVLLIYLFLLILWYLWSYYLKKQLLKKEAISSDDFIEDFESGYEVLVDANTLGLGKKIGYEKIKIFFACSAIAMSLITLLVLLIVMVNFEFLVLLTDKNILVPACVFIYIFTILVGYKPVKKKMKI